MVVAYTGDEEKAGEPLSISRGDLIVAGKWADVSLGFESAVHYDDTDWANAVIAYQAVPLSITVEGANILTRSLIIFGQGAIRAHPWLLKEMEAARDPRPTARKAFDRAYRERGRRVRVRLGFSSTSAVSVATASVVSDASDILPVILAYTTSWSASFSPLNLICPR
mgnify:CR=1 FL=1